MYIVELNGQYVQIKKKEEVTWTTDINAAKVWKTKSSANKVADELQALVMELEVEEVEEVFRARTRTIASDPRQVRKFIFPDLRTIEDWVFQKEQLPKCIFEIYVEGQWQDINSTN